MTRQHPAPPSSQWIDRYLRLLGIDAAPPGPAALAELLHAHVLAVPFENVTALLRRDAHPRGDVPPPDLGGLLDAWEQRRGGGVCFDICPMLVRLLVALGYNAHLVLGRISLPNGHQAVLVELDGARFLLDPGNGAPLFAPIALDGPSVEVHRHGLSYRFRHDNDAQRLVQERKPDGEWNPHCHYDLRGADPLACNTGYQHHHTVNASWVTGTLTMVRSTPDAVHALRDNVLSVFTANGKTTQTVTATAEFERIAATVFGLPNLPIARALAVRQRYSQLAD